MTFVVKYENNKYIYVYEDWYVTGKELKNTIF